MTNQDKYWFCMGVMFTSILTICVAVIFYGLAIWTSPSDPMLSMVQFEMSMLPEPMSSIDQHMATTHKDKYERAIPNFVVMTVPEKITQEEIDSLAKKIGIVEYPFTFPSDSIKTDLSKYSVITDMYGTTFPFDKIDTIFVNHKIAHRIDHTIFVSINGKNAVLLSLNDGSVDTIFYKGNRAPTIIDTTSREINFKHMLSFTNPPNQLNLSEARIVQTPEGLLVTLSYPPDTICTNPAITKIISGIKLAKLAKIDSQNAILLMRSDGLVDTVYYHGKGISFVDNRIDTNTVGGISTPFIDSYKRWAFLGNKSADHPYHDLDDWSDDTLSFKNILVPSPDSEDRGCWDEIGMPCVDPEIKFEVSQLRLLDIDDHSAIETTWNNGKKDTIQFKSKATIIRIDPYEPQRRQYIIDGYKFWFDVDSTYKIDTVYNLPTEQDDILAIKSPTFVDTTVAEYWFALTDGRAARIYSNPLWTYVVFYEWTGVRTIENTTYKPLTWGQMRTLLLDSGEKFEKKTVIDTTKQWNKKQFRLGWCSLKTGATGYGTGKFSFHEARSICYELNKQDKGLLYHWIEEVR